MFTTGTQVLADVDLLIRQGSDCTWALVYSETDPTTGTLQPNTFVGWSARSQIRKRVGGDVWLTQSVSLQAASNKLTVKGHIPAATTEDPAWDSYGSGRWDVELVRDDGTVIPLAAGNVLIDHDVTRST